MVVVIDGDGVHNDSGSGAGHGRHGRHDGDGNGTGGITDANPPVSAYSSTIISLFSFSQLGEAGVIELAADEVVNVAVGGIRYCYGSSGSAGIGTTAGATIVTACSSFTICKYVARRDCIGGNSNTPDGDRCGTSPASAAVVFTTALLFTCLEKISGNAQACG